MYPFKGAGQSRSIDTTTVQGRLTFHLMGVLAEFEGSLIVERTQAGLQAARKRGPRLGRPKALTSAQVKHARKFIYAGERPTTVAQSFGVNRSTLYRNLKGDLNINWNILKIDKSSPSPNLSPTTVHTII
ncbi:recombinase family protein [Hoeflea phototrophica]|uniref:recombinase family protein n=1 Tax=Hoeflea phototrophica TaxID=244596 RepID=UPI00031C5A07